MDFFVLNLFEHDGQYFGYISFSIATVQSHDGSFEAIKEMTDVQQNMSYAIPALKITRLCVVDEMQGQGIGKLMMAFADILAIQTQAKTG